MSENKDTEQKEPVLAIYDVSGIQEYIFATNHLKENIGASLIVTNSLNECLLEALKDYQDDEKKIVIDWANQENNCFQMKKNPNIAAEIIYIGGGNAFVVYREVDLYNKVSRNFAKRFLKKTSHLTILTAAEKTSFNNFCEERDTLNKKLEQIKGKLIRQEPLSLFPIVEQESTYGYPVTKISQGKSLSSVQMEKQKEYDEKRKENQFAPFTLEDGILWAKEMEELTTKKGQDSFVAVVHIDGNGMGDMLDKRLKNIKSEYDVAVPEMRKISLELSNIFNSIYKEIIDYFQKRLKTSKKLGTDEGILPIRHVIMDGDDVTFICNARLAIPIVAIFLKLIMQKEENETLSACAGIAFVHSHYPFRIAYQVAESCCGKAKEKWYSEKKEREEKHLQEPMKKGYFDFQLIRGAGQTDLDLIRNENFTCPKEAITRPYYVSMEKEENDIHSFECLDKLMKKLPEENDKKEWPRTRLKKLYEAYLQGEKEVELLKEENDSRGYLFEAFSNEKNLSLFDALELMDMYDRKLFQDFFEFHKSY